MKKTSLTFSSYTNAYALYIGSKRLGVDLYTLDKAPLFPIPYKKIAKADFLVFTEESSLKKALAGDFDGDFLPEKFPIQILDDKWALAEWLKKDSSLIQGIRQWDIKEYDEVVFPCLIKAKHSWSGDIKLPRGWVCRTREELLERLDEIKSFNNWESIFFIQEWLGDKNCKVISTCGFHDHESPRRNLSVVVQRVVSHSIGLSCSAAVETVEDVWGLRQNTEKILNALEFTGPYEMEYLLIGDTFKVLEINPRFWMQHAIFLKNGNGLMKRYYCLDGENDWINKDYSHIVWIDTIHLLKTLMKGQLGFFSFVIHAIKKNRKSILLWPSLPVSLFVFSRILLRKIKKF